jgi:ribosomal protein S4
MSDEHKLILLEDFLEQRLRKEQEISYYEKQLQEIEKKLFFLRKERELTATIIDMLSREKVVDLKDMVEEKLLIKKPDVDD